MDRRQFLRRSVAGAGALALGPSFWSRAYGAPATAGAGPYGALLEPDANGVRLPPGFRSRIVARSGQAVEGTEHGWHANPDGGATYATGDGGWIYVSNSESSPATGGASAVRFDAGGEIVDAYTILEGTSQNCAGGQTPWGTWLSCEEHPLGQVWECDPFGEEPADVRPAMGTFSHEAVAVDPAGERLYLTEDDSQGLYYRFTPDRYPDLSAGTLEAAEVGTGGAVTWHAVSNPAGVPPTRTQVPDATTFDGGEGIWYDAGFVYLTTKGDNRVWIHDLAADTVSVLYDAADFDDPALTGVDNVTVGASGDLFVAEDGGDMQIVLITGDDRVVAPFLQIVGHDASEVTGPAFDPSFGRLYFSSQRGADVDGVTYEVSGPFRGAGAGGSGVTTTTAPGPTTTLAGLAGASGVGGGSRGGSQEPLPATGGVLGMAALGLGALGLAARRLDRRMEGDGES